MRVRKGINARAPTLFPDEIRRGAILDIEPGGPAGEAERKSSCAPQHPSGNHPQVTQVRSTLISASLQGIRYMGWEERYFATLPQRLARRDPTPRPGSVAADLDRHRALHGVRSDEPLERRDGGDGALGVGPDAEDVRGDARQRRRRRRRDPWHIFNGHRIGSRIFHGGDRARRTSSARRTWTSCAWGARSSSLRYFRVALGAYYAALAGVLSSSVHWRELAEYRRDDTIGLRVSWV